MKKRLNIIIFFLSFFVFTITANSGDYTLTISDGPNAPCAAPVASRENWHNPIRTSPEIAEDIYRYFHGEEPKLRIFRGAFGNAHIKFCGRKEKENIHKALLEVIRFDNINHEAHLYDYMYMLGDKHFLKMIDNELSKNNSEIVQERLNKAKDAVNKRYD